MSVTRYMKTLVPELGESLTSYPAFSLLAGAVPQISVMAPKAGEKRKGTAAAAAAAKGGAKKQKEPRTKKHNNTTNTNTAKSSGGDSCNSKAEQHPVLSSTAAPELVPKPTTTTTTKTTTQPIKSMGTRKDSGPAPAPAAVPVSPAAEEVVIMGGEEEEQAAPVPEPAPVSVVPDAEVAPVVKANNSNRVRRTGGPKLGARGKKERAPTTTTTNDTPATRTKNTRRSVAPAPQESPADKAETALVAVGQSGTHTVEMGGDDDGDDAFEAGIAAAEPQTHSSPIGAAAVVPLSRPLARVDTNAKKAKGSDRPEPSVGKRALPASSSSSSAPRAKKPAMPTAKAPAPARAESGIKRKEPSTAGKYA